MKRPQPVIMKVIVLSVGLFVAVGLTRSVYELWRRRDIVVERQKALEQVEKENTHLKRELEEAQSPEFVEKQAREKLNMAMPDETVVLVGEASPSRGINRKINLFEDEKPSWKLWWELFF